jgi:hypothetical protein
MSSLRVIAVAIDGCDRSGAELGDNSIVGQDLYSTKQSSFARLLTTDH